MAGVLTGYGGILFSAKGNWALLSTDFFFFFFLDFGLSVCCSEGLTATRASDSGVASL